MKNEEIVLCKKIVQDLGIKLIIIDFMGQERVYSVEGFILPDNHGFYGEIQNGKDITLLIKNGQFNFYDGKISQNRFDELTKSLVKETFYFGTRNFLLITAVKDDR